MLITRGADDDDDGEFKKKNVEAENKNLRDLNLSRYIYWIPKFTDHNYDNVWNILETKENVNRNY